MKRLREPKSVDVGLVEIYEDLAHEDEEVRLKAVRSLIKDHQPDVPILTRLFRGLCSGRKAARVGFSVALTELLYQLSLSVSEQSPSVPQIVSILQKQTTPEGSARGQDERDHYFGRLFGCEALIKSELLFHDHSLEQWSLVLDMVCTMALQRPWLRQMCGWILYNCIRTSLVNSRRQQFINEILNKLTTHKLIRTPEGLAVWIEVQQHHLTARLPDGVWKDKNPFYEKNIQILADVLKDARTDQKNDVDLELQGSAMWSANLHFVWDVVLAKLLLQQDDCGTEQAVDFHLFWQTAVDEALFNPSNSKERKQWGFSAMCKALEIAPWRLMRTIFSKNAVSNLVQSLMAGDRYLQHSAHSVIETLQRCVAQKPDDAASYILAFFRGIDMVDIDKLTNTNITTDLFDACRPTTLRNITVGLNSDLRAADVSVPPTSLTQKRRNILNHESKLVSQWVNKALQGALFVNEDDILTVLDDWIRLIIPTSSFPEIDKKLVSEKIQFAYEHVLKLGQAGQRMILNSIARMQSGAAVSAEADVMNIIKSGWERFGQLRDLADSTSAATNDDSSRELNSQSPFVGSAEAAGLAMLYGLLLFEIYSGDTEAIDILRELLDSEETTSSIGSSIKVVDHGGADAIVEILLSFASRPSKFLRRITLIIFETLTQRITRDGLQSLIAILAVRETEKGQNELFEANDDVDLLNDMSNDNEIEAGSDVEMLDSDVEVVSASASESASANASGSEADSDSESSDEGSTDTEEGSEVNDANLLALEASLASALGTRKLTQADMEAASSSSESDSDMTDSEMIALDVKLAEVFRNRKDQSNEKKKKQQKDARENIINFKNRVMDMLEVYMRKEHLNSRSLDAILPLLQLERQTNTKQLGDRALKLLQTYCKRCSGFEKVPVLLPMEAESGESTRRPDIGDDDENDKGRKDDSTKFSVAAKKHETQKKKKTEKQDERKNGEDMQQKKTMTTGHTVSSALSLLHAIHAEAVEPNTSNAHCTASSKASIVLVKSLLKASQDSSSSVSVNGGIKLEQIDRIYANTEAIMSRGEEGEGVKEEAKGRKGKSDSKGAAAAAATSAVQQHHPKNKGQKDFLLDWKNWRKSVEGRFI